MPGKLQETFSGNRDFPNGCVQTFGKLFVDSHLKRSIEKVSCKYFYLTIIGSAAKRSSWRPCIGAQGIFTLVQ